MKKTLKIIIGISILFICIVGFILSELLLKKEEISQKIVETTSSIVFGFTISITFSFVLNINAKNINLFSKVVNNSNTEEDKQENRLQDFLEKIYLLENKVKDLKKLRDKNEMNQIVDLRKEIEEQIKDQRAALYPIIESKNKSKYIGDCCNIIENYYKNVEKLLSTIDDENYKMQVNLRIKMSSYFDDFDRVYDEIKDIKVSYPDKNSKINKNDVK